MRKSCSRSAIAEAGLDRKTIFVTNAVKHFKFEPRGKRRLHKRPNAYEIERCRWWLEIEHKIVKPQLIVALGATAARSLIGRAVTLLVSIHPSALLRIKDSKDKAMHYAKFVDDLRRCAKIVDELPSQVERAARRWREARHQARSWSGRAS
jgi:DNA polymerase